MSHLMRAVAVYSNLGEASLALSVIEGSGISAHLENVESSVNMSGGPALIRLMVDEADYEAASALLTSAGGTPADGSS